MNTQNSNCSVILPRTAFDPFTFPAWTLSLKVSSLTTMSAMCIVGSKQWTGRAHVHVRVVQPCQGRSGRHHDHALGLWRAFVDQVFERLECVLKCSSALGKLWWHERQFMRLQAAARAACTMRRSPSSFANTTNSAVPRPESTSDVRVTAMLHARARTHWHAAHQTPVCRE